MVRPADRLWIGPDIPAHIPLEVSELKIDLLDPTPDGGWVATYRERYSVCQARGQDSNCKAIVKIFDKAKLTASVSLDTYLSRPDHLEVQDVRYAGGTIYFNEACQSYSSEAGGKCSALVALDPSAKKVLWRTGPLISNNEFRVFDKYIVAAYGFMKEPAAIRIVRRSDGKIMEKQALANTNFEMSSKGDTLSVELYYKFGRANFRMAGFEGDAPQLVPLATTPPDPNDKPKPYSPPLLTSPTATPF